MQRGGARVIPKGLPPGLTPLTATPAVALPSRSGPPDEHGVKPVESIIVPPPPPRIPLPPLAAATADSGRCEVNGTEQLGEMRGLSAAAVPLWRKGESGAPSSPPGLFPLHNTGSGSGSSGGGGGVFLSPSPRRTSSVSQQQQYRKLAQVCGRGSCRASSVLC